MSLNIRNALSNAFVGGGGGGATLAANTFTGQQVISVNGAASTPPLLLSGTIFTGGSATTTKPQLLVEPAGTTSTGWSTSGTLLGVNAPSGFAGNTLDIQRNGTRDWAFTSTGKLLCNVAYSKAANSVAIGDSQGGISFSNGGTFFSGGGSSVASVSVGSGLAMSSAMKLGFSSSDADAAAPDVYFVRSAASIIGVLGASAGGGAVELSEMTAPSAPAANKVRIYSEDNGSGKTRLMALFPSGAAQQIAIEP